MKNNRKNIILAVVLTLSIITLVASVTYAYFTNNISAGEEVDVKATTPTEAKVEFNYGDDVVLENIEPGESVESISSITLTASNTDPESLLYTIRIRIIENGFTKVVGHENDAQLEYSLYFKKDNDTDWTFFTKASCDDRKPSISDRYLSLGANANESSIVYWKLVVNYNDYDYDQSINMNKKFHANIEFVER